MSNYLSDSYMTVSKSPNSNIYDRLFDFLDEFHDSRAVIDRLIVHLTKLHHPLENGLQKIKAVQKSCIQTLHLLNEPLLGRINDMLTECERLETVSQTLDGIRDYSECNRQPFYDFRQNIFLLLASFGIIKDMLDRLSAEIDTVSDELSDELSEINDFADNMDDVAMYFNSLLDDLDDPDNLVY